LKRIYSSFNQVAVHHLRNLLETAGIPAVVRNTMLSSAMGELPTLECEAQLWILEDSDQQRAEQVISAPPVTGTDWTCRCGETLGPQFTQCWRCGAERL
jgi:hypothetical protein